MRRERAARVGPELFLFERAFEDCLDRLTLVQRRFEQALLIGCPDPSWPDRILSVVSHVDVADPDLVEDSWQPPESAYDLVLAVGTFDTVNDLPVALRLIRFAMRGDGLFLGALSGGDTLPQLRNAMRAADAVTGAAAPHVHPRVEASALAPLLADAGFVHPVVDVDRVAVSYTSIESLIDDLRRIGATNVISARPRFVSRSALDAAGHAFRAAGDGNRTVETFEILHFAAWTKTA